MRRRYARAWERGYDDGLPGRPRRVADGAERGENMKQRVQVGDWVCFQQLGSPAYALVLYVLPSNSSLGDMIVTTHGETHEDNVLEIRRSS